MAMEQQQDSITTGLREAGFAVIAHRGGAGLGPENTLAAARAGFESGALAWELDVALTREGGLVLMHDDGLERTTDAALIHPQGSPWPVSEYDLKELAEFDAGSWWEGEPGWHPFAGEPIPTLEDALAFTRNHGWLVNVEIKDCPGHPMEAEFAAKVLAAIDRAGMRQRVIVSSFNHDYLRELRAFSADITIGVLVEEIPQNIETTLAELNAFSLHPEWLEESIPEISRLAGLGVRQYVYTVNEPDDALRLKKAGADGVITDRPDLMRGFAY